jgi:hypothetical protein
VVVLSFCPDAWAAEPTEPHWVAGGSSDVRDAAARLLGLLGKGNIEAAARLSNAPERRYEVLREYRDAIGDDAFRQLYVRYLSPPNRVVAEAALGVRRLLIWELVDADRQLAGQFFIEVDGSFLLDDIPSPERARLQRALQDYRNQNNR